MLTQARLKELLHYDPATGAWTWLVDRAHVVRAGQAAGSANGNGYTRITVDGRRYYLHRLAWFYMKGEWPVGEVDHENTVPSDNRWENLRPAGRVQNAANCRRSKANTSGYKGVYFNKRRGKFHAKIKKNYQSIHLGYFDDPREAHAAYIAAAERLSGEYARAG